APVWLFFEPPFEEDGKQKAKCSLCAHDKYLIITCGSTTKALVKWIASKSLSFVIVESENFQELVKLIKVLDDVEVSFVSTVKRDLLN
ncbi:12439_t:CDS:2, partial [Racocetra persica]